jgi:hypothetical protein
MLLVHGRGFKPAEATLFALCKSALRAGIERDYAELALSLADIQCDMAYYGDLSNALLTASGRQYDEALDVGDRQNALATLQRLAARKDFGIRRYDRLPGKTALREFLADIAAPTLGILGLWMWLCERCSLDFATYLGADSDYAEQLRGRVRGKLLPMLERGDRIALITHGTGSAVAWDVLWELSNTAAYREQLHNRKVDLWLTMGSPLGDDQVRRRLRGSGESGAARYPGNVISWCNVAAEDDYTCHDKTLSDDLKKMLQERLVSSVTDYRIYNQAIRYGTSNPHSSIGYLVHPQVSKIVAEWMMAASDPVVSSQPGEMKTAGPGGSG